MDNGTSKDLDEALLKRIIERLEGLRGQTPFQVETVMREVELALVDFRDGLIEAVRTRGRKELRSALHQADTALSLIIVLEHPVGGKEREKLEEAIELLKTLKATASA